MEMFLQQAIPWILKTELMLWLLDLLKWLLKEVQWHPVAESTELLTKDELVLIRADLDKRTKIIMTFSYISIFPQMFLSNLSNEIFLEAEIRSM